MNPKLTLNFHYVDVTYVPTEALLKSSSKTRRDQESCESNGYAQRHQSASFENFERTDGRGYASLEALDFVEQYSADPKSFHKGLYLVGSFGIGKTYLLGATAKELAIKGFTTTLVHFPTFAVEMKPSHR